ncbi:MAG TPA: trypsin-like peptidase domain-containing protein [Planktothrix sp.]|jgi:serine protease Do
MSATRKSAFTCAFTLCLASLVGGAAVAEPIIPQPAPIMAGSAGDALVKSGAIPIQSNTIADIAQAAAPAVVSIEVQSTKTLDLSGMGMGGMGSMPFPYQFFFNGQQVKPGQGGKPQIHSTAAGSGFIVRSDGYIVTNAHVVRGHNDKIKVTLNDERSFDATIVGSDAFSDLAVIKIDAKDLPTLKMGDSKDLRAGEFVVAIGNAQGLGQSVTFGIVSAVGRTLVDINGNINFIQTDAAINHGNSGGPLLNLAGEVVGVNTAINERGQSMGFSTPVDVVKSVSADLIQYKKVSRPWLGISMETLDETLNRALGLASGTKGVLVKELIKYGGKISPAEAAGVQIGDVIVKIDGQDMTTGKEVHDYVLSRKVQDSVHLLLLRKNALMPLTVVMGNYPELPAHNEDENE